MTCANELCTITWAETPGKPVSFQDKKAKKDADKAILVSLARKWKAGTITPAEKDELLKNVVLGLFLLD